MSADINEKTKVERPLIEQLKTMGWKHLPGDIDVPYLTERESFREVLLRERIKNSLRAINLDAKGQPWLDDRRIEVALGALERLGATKLLEANQVSTDLLLKGVAVEGVPGWDGGRDQIIHFVDFQHLERNDFLVVDQFRVDPPWAVANKDFIIPDLVLFVNGIPLVVIECKSPNITDPMEEGITQLRRYANQREEVEGDEGAEKLFHYNQFMVSTYFYKARVGTISASYEHYLEWKDTSPVPMSKVAEDLGTKSLSSQQVLVAGMLRPAHLLDIVRNFTLFQQADGTTIKIVTRYQQFRAVHEAIRRLSTGKTREQHGTTDQRGGIIWHTQGSGKSLTMVFLVRKMRTLDGLRRFKIVVVTDRIALQKQLSETAVLTGEKVRTATNSKKLRTLLAEKGADLVFAMIQKYRDSAEGDVVAEKAADGKGKTLKVAKEDETFEELNDSTEILTLVDEAHRGHASGQHANMMQAIPNCARIAFTGTPILKHDWRETQKIFGGFIDRYTIKQSEDDGATVPIIYEGRTAKGKVADGRSLDALFEDMFRERTPKELEAIKRKYATKGNVLEAPKLIEAKAKDMLRHYVSTVLPNGFKAQVVGVSRLAAVRYREALAKAYRELLEKIEALSAKVLALDDEALLKQDAETQFLVRAHAQLGRLRKMEFAAVISGGHNDSDRSWRDWSDKSKQALRIARFKKPFEHKDPEKCDGLAFLCVKSMLLVGFDAPVEQVLYVDRALRDHELLQAIARVNRTASKKSRGFVVDYVGIGHHLKEALEAYGQEDIKGALIDIHEELPKLADRHQRVLDIFKAKGIKKIDRVDDCVEALRDMRVRADFIVKLRQFLESLDIIMPRREALPYIRDAKILGFINQAAHNLYRDSRLNIMGVADKVRHLIDTHIVSTGVDPKVPPISIMDSTFKTLVQGRKTSRTKAAEMEHAVRYHITKCFAEDPAYYKSLSEKLERILQTFKENWDALVAALDKLVTEVQEGRPADQTGLDPKTHAPFLGIILEELNGRRPKSGSASEVKDATIPGEDAGTLKVLADIVVDLVEHIRQEIRRVDFWKNAHAQRVLRSWIVARLDEKDVLPYARLEAVADRIVELAKARHTALTT